MKFIYIVIFASLCDSNEIETLLNDGYKCNFTSNTSNKHIYTNTHIRSHKCTQFL